MRSQSLEKPKNPMGSGKINNRQAIDHRYASMAILKNLIKQSYRAEEKTQSTYHSTRTLSRLLQNP
jgi:hypothetical protein